LFYTIWAQTDILALVPQYLKHLNNEVIAGRSSTACVEVTIIQ